MNDEHEEHTLIDIDKEVASKDMLHNCENELWPIGWLKWMYVGLFDNDACRNLLTTNGL